MFISVSCVQTFLTLSLTDMANRVQLSNPREAEKYVLHMVGTQCLFLPHLTSPFWHRQAYDSLHTERSVPSHYTLMEIASKVVAVLSIFDTCKYLITLAAWLMWSGDMFASVTWSFAISSPPLGSVQWWSHDASKTCFFSRPHLFWFLFLTFVLRLRYAVDGKLKSKNCFWLMCSLTTH